MTNCDKCGQSLPDIQDRINKAVLGVMSDFGVETPAIYLGLKEARELHDGLSRHVRIGDEDATLKAMRRGEMKMATATNYVTIWLVETQEHFGLGAPVRRRK